MFDFAHVSLADNIACGTINVKCFLSLTFSLIEPLCDLLLEVDLILL